MFTIAGTEVTFFNFIHIYRKRFIQNKINPFLLHSSTQILYSTLHTLDTFFKANHLFFFSLTTSVVCPLFFFFWPLRCLFLFDWQILITPLVSSNSSAPKFTFSKKHLFYIMWSHFLLKLDNPNVIAFSTHLSMISSNYSIKF